MADIIVCYKWVMDDQDIKVNPSTRELVTAGAKYKISEYDKNALEIAVQLKEKNGGTVKALSFGGSNIKSSLKDILSRGADEAICISSEKAPDADASATAKILASAIQQQGSYDLVVCGDGSADLYSQQVAQRIAVLLHIPVIDNVEALTSESGKWIARRQLRDEVETVSFSGPAVVSVVPGIAKARIPGMKQILGAGKKPQKVEPLSSVGIEVANIASASRQISVKGAVQSRKNIVIKESDPEKAVAALMSALKKDGIL